MPGTSNHGWGKAVDIETSPAAADSRRRVQVDDGQRRSLGLIHPSATNEAWHWEWVGDGGTMRGTPVAQDLWSWPMKVGAVGNNVTSVQRALAAQGLNVVPDGDFGMQTNGAVSFFQATHHLPVTGAVDLSTAMALQAFS